MYTGSRDPRYTEVPTETSWRSLAAWYGLLAAAVLLLYTMSNPLAGATVVAGALGLVVATPKTVPLVRRLADCGGFVLDVTDDLQVCVVRPSADGPC